MGRINKKNRRKSIFYLQEQGKFCSRGQQEYAFSSYNRNTVIRNEKLFLQLKFLSSSKEWLLLILWWGYTDLFFVILGMQRRTCSVKWHLLLVVPSVFIILYFCAVTISELRTCKHLNLPAFNLANILISTERYTTAGNETGRLSTGYNFDFTLTVSFTLTYKPSNDSFLAYTMSSSVPQ